MPSIHVIYDPQDKVHSRPEMNQKIGISVIVMQVPEDLDENTIDSFVGDAITRLLDQAGIPK